MSHECEDCGASFETLTRLRLHDCSDAPAGDAAASSEPTSHDEAPPEGRATTTAPTGEAGPIDELDALLDRAADGDVDALYRAVAEFDEALGAASAKSGDQYRSVFWHYYEPLAEALDPASHEAGWPVLRDLIEAYDPRETGDLPLATPVVANAVGRHVIRIRHTDEAAAIPAAGLAYLRSIPVYASEAADVEREEAHAYGWGIGHPEHPVADHIQSMAVEHRFWALATLEHAFYADQHAAVDLLARILRDESITFSVSHPTGTIGSARFYLDSVVGPDSDRYWPNLPRYWDWREEYDYTFAWDPTVEERIRDLVRETGVVDDLPDDWSFQDLAL